MRRNNVMTAAVPDSVPIRKRTENRTKLDLPTIPPTPTTATLTLEFAAAPTVAQSTSEKPRVSKRVTPVKAAPHLTLAIMPEAIAPEAPAPVAAKTPRAKAATTNTPPSPDTKIQAAATEPVTSKTIKAAIPLAAVAQVPEASTKASKPTKQIAPAEPAPTKIVRTKSEPTISVQAPEAKAKPAAKPIVQTAAIEPAPIKTIRAKNVATTTEATPVEPVQVSTKAAKPKVQATVALPVLPIASEKTRGPVPELPEAKPSPRKPKVQTGMIAPAPLATPVKAKAMAPQSVATSTASIPAAIVPKATPPKPKPALIDKAEPVQAVTIIQEKPKVTTPIKRESRVLPVAASKSSKVKTLVPKEPPVRIIPEFEYTSGRLWRMSGRHAVALVKDAALAGELLATEPKNLTRDAMAVYYDRKGKAFAWQVRFDTDRWNDIVRRLE